MKINVFNELREGVIFEADDTEDDDWKPIIKILAKNGYQVGYADGNYMSFFRPIEKKKGEKCQK